MLCQLTRNSSKHQFYVKYLPTVNHRQFGHQLLTFVQKNEKWQMACPGSLKQPNHRLNPPATTKWAGLLHGPSISTRLRMRNGPKLTGMKVIMTLLVSFNANRTIHCSQALTSQLQVWHYGLKKR